MLQMLVVTLREGIEAFLIVAIAITYLRKTGRDGLVPAAWWGTAIAVTLSAVLGVFLAEFAVLPIWEAVLAAVAAVLVISMVVYMLKHARKMRGEIGGRIESAAQAPGAGPWIGVFLLVLLMITREGMEMAFITATLARQEESVHMFWGALVGIALAAGLAWAWSRYGHRINLGLRSSSSCLRCNCSYTRSTRPPRRTCCRSTISTGTSLPNPTVPKGNTARF